MELRYDEDLVEAAVHISASGTHPRIAPLQIARFHREREKLYAILDPDERNAAFFKLHLEWFREWNLERALTGLLEEFPDLRQNLSALAFRKARGRNEEGAELYVNPTAGKTAVVALRAERFAGPAELSRFLRHEFMHLNDMIAPGFGYAPRLAVPTQHAAQQRLARERYRVLWDITIDARVAAAGHEPMADRDRHVLSFARAFAFWPEARRRQIFESLWSNGAPKHSELETLVADPRDLAAGGGGARPGAPCPLCDFPTFAWGDSTRLSSDIMAAIAAEFPGWKTEQGLCGRCCEAYEAAVAHKAPTPAACL